ncbi:MAG: hypothetical protein ACXABO_16970 [Promethearchaeota archaeon]
MFELEQISFDLEQKKFLLEELKVDTTRFYIEIDAFRYRKLRTPKGREQKEEKLGAEILHTKIKIIDDKL